LIVHLKKLTKTISLRVYSFQAESNLARNKS